MRNSKINLANIGDTMLSTTTYQSRQMSLTSFREFEKAFQASVGFDSFFHRLFDVDSSATASTGYPPYNIKKTSEYAYQVEMALAGFSKDDLQVEVADGTLSIKTVPSEKEEGDEFLHRGIAMRQFSRKFILSDDVVVKGADLYNGLLTIDLERVVPEEKKPREIPINDGVKVVEHKVV